jgi:hypothetical protein
MNNLRQNFRLRRQVDVTWEIPEASIKGVGRIYNLSFSGACFDVKGFFKLKKGMVFTLSSSEIPPLPSHAKLMWFRKGEQESFLCGAAFLRENYSFPASWKKWLEENIEKLADTHDNTILSNYLGIEEE